MYQTAHPVTAPTPSTLAATRCPECGTPVVGIATTRPGRHEFVACGHRAALSLRALADAPR